MDLRVERIFHEEFKNDKSSFGRFTLYSPREVKEIWQRGVKHGIEIGLRKASLDGQLVELDQNTMEGKEREFIEKFFSLAEEYSCAIQHHPELGMVVVSRLKSIIK